MEKGVPGTKEVIKLKTSLKSLRTKNTFAVKNLQREQGLFLECISEVSEGDQLTSFQYAQLERVASAMSSVEKSFGKVFYSKLLISIHWSLKKKTENVVTQNFWSAKISHSKLSLEAK